jgi:hypothetical protein
LLLHDDLTVTIITAYHKQQNKHKRQTGIALFEIGSEDSQHHHKQQQGEVRQIEAAEGGVREGEPLVWM